MKKLIAGIVIIAIFFTLTFILTLSSSKSVMFALFFIGYGGITAILIWIPIRFINNRWLLYSGAALILLGISSYILTAQFFQLEPDQKDVYKQFYLILAAAVGANFVAQAAIEQRAKKKKQC